MTQPLTPGQEAAAYYQSQMMSPNPGAVPVPAAPPPAPVPAAAPPPTVSQIWANPKLSYQQKLALSKTAAPDAAPPAPAPLSPADQLESDRAHGKISYQQYMAAKANPQAYVNPNTPQQNTGLKPGDPNFVGPPTAPKNLVVAGQNGQPAAGAAEGQGGQPPDLVAPYLRPGGVAGVAPHAVGYSPADKNYLASLNEQGQITQSNAEKNANAVQSIADAYQQNASALNAQSQQGALDYQNHLNDLADRRKQLNTDAMEAQKRIEGKLSELEATGTDPNRYFHNQTTGQNLLGGLLVGLGAFGAHALGPGGHDSTNTALEIMNGAIQRDVDAQRTDMQKSLSVLGQRMNLNAQGFDQQKAMLEAERESIQTGYQIAINETARRAAQFKDNADVQLKSTQIQDGLRGSAVEKIGALNDRIYALQKGAERIVGGGAGAGIDPKEFDQLTREYMKEQSDAGVPPEKNTIAAAHAFILNRRYGIATPGADTSLAPKPNKGGAANSARTARLLEGHMSNDQKLARMQEIIKGAGPLGYLNGPEVAELNTLGAQLKADHVEGIPDFSRFNVGRITGAQQASIGAQKTSEHGRVENIKGIVANGPGAPEAEGEGNPAGLDEEKEDKD